MWLAWLVVWILAAGRTARTVVRQPLGSRLWYSVPLWVGIYVLLPRGRRPDVFQDRVYPVGAEFAWLCVVVVAAGLVYAGWARVHIGRLWSSTVTLKVDHTVIRTGPYARSRHPIYTGLLLALFATAARWGTLGALLSLVLFVLGFMVKIRQEEHLLLEHFGDAYRGYQHEVPTLVPWFRGWGS
jgi:protein-S-isoprenylcysteine O-methyltransferase Ste14